MIIFSLTAIDVDKEISNIQIATSEKLQNLTVECSTNSVVDVIRRIAANSLKNLTKSAIPRLFLENVPIRYEYRNG